MEQDNEQQNERPPVEPPAAERPVSCDIGPWMETIEHNQAVAFDRLDRINAGLRFYVAITLAGVAWRVISKMVKAVTPLSFEE